MKNIGMVSEKNVSKHLKVFLKVAPNTRILSLKYQLV